MHPFYSGIEYRCTSCGMHLPLCISWIMNLSLNTLFPAEGRHLVIRNQEIWTWRYGTFEKRDKSSPIESQFPRQNQSNSYRPQHHRNSPRPRHFPEWDLSKSGIAHLSIHSHFRISCVVGRFSGSKDRIDRNISITVAFSSTSKFEILACCRGS